MSVNALLIRWKYGYTQVGATTSPIRYGYLTLGSIETESEAKRIGGQELLRVEGVRDQISLGADPAPPDPANAYGTGWTVGDYVLVPARPTATITAGGVWNDGTWDEGNWNDVGDQSQAARVLQVSVAEDDNATLSVLPDLQTLLEQYEVRTQRWLTRMADGTMNGSSAVVSPIVTPEFIPGRRPQSTTQTFSWPQEAILNYRTAPWTPEVAGRLAQMHLRRGRSSTPVAGDVAGALHVAFIVNGTTLDEGIIHDGQEESIFGGSGVGFRPGDRLELQPTTVPAGTVSLTARVIQTHYH